MNDRLIPTYTDISSWDVSVYQNTGGTRSKQIAIHPNSNKDYFFKGSKVTEFGEIKYPMEFWSEIISSKIGQILDFNMLDYNIAYRASDYQKIGCLSESMVEHSENKLTEGVSYLTGYKPSYRPNLKNHQSQYTFQFICQALKEFGLENYIDEIIKIIIFDSIIGNSDRHQENWGTITYFKKTLDNLNEILANDKIKFWDKILIRLVRIATKNAAKQHEISKKIKGVFLKLQKDIAPQNFAPIYDSGCSFGRELTDINVNKIIKDNQMLEAYVKNGVSEIRWEGNLKKLNHFDLISAIKKYHKLEVEKTIENVNSKFNYERIRSIIWNIDLNLPSDLEEFKLQDNRKDLIFKIVTLRLGRLKTIK